MKHLEDNLQRSCIRWFDYRYPKLRLLLHHSPNGGRRDEREAARFKAMGVRAGFPDLILLVPNGEYPFLGIELKTAKGRQSEHQKEYEAEFGYIGAKYVVVRSSEEFVNTIESYLKNFNYAGYKH